MLERNNTVIKLSRRKSDFWPFLDLSFANVLSYFLYHVISLELNFHSSGHALARFSVPAS